MAEQPDLPGGFPWPDRTIEWWRIWADSPQAATITATGWQDLLDGALLHAAIWGNYDITAVNRLHAITTRYGGDPSDVKPESKGTPLDELAKRRAPAGATAARKPRPARGA